MLETARFTRVTKEERNFTCVVCGTKVQGNGYTDHCLKCLASTHEDRNPGDRASNCHGVMEPIEMEIHGREERIVYKCERCGYIHRNKVSPKDNRETVRLVASHQWRRSLFQR